MQTFECRLENVLVIAPDPLLSLSQQKRMGILDVFTEFVIADQRLLVLISVG